MSADLYTAPQHVGLTHVAQVAPEATLAAPGGRSMQDRASELPRIPLPRTPVNKGLPLAIMLTSTRRRPQVNEPGNETGRLKDKSALVTGASSGLGRATAIALARSGADVALVARSAEELESAKEVSKTDCRALSLPTDLAKEEETSATVERTFEEFGRIDVLVNAAGTDAPGTVE